MPIPAEVKSHHTVSVRAETTHPVPVRYSVDRDRLVCFGDGQLGDVPAGAGV
jgi:predicted transcriptional regulator